MKADRVVACGLVAVALACAGVRPAVAAESYWYGDANAFRDDENFILRF